MEIIPNGTYLGKNTTVKYLRVETAIIVEDSPYKMLFSQNTVLTMEKIQITL